MNSNITEGNMMENWRTFNELQSKLIFKTPTPLYLVNIVFYLT